MNSLHRVEAPTLNLNEIGRCTLMLDEPIMFDGYRRNHGTGAFIIIDRITNITVGAGMILDRVTGDQRHDHWDDEPMSSELQSESSIVTEDQRRARFGQTPVTVLFTGLPGSGKTSTAYAVERRLFEDGRATMVLDGQNMRLGISRDLGFADEDRSENLRRTSEVARLFNQSGLICLMSLVAPREEVRQKARDVVGNDQFLVVHMSAPEELCEERDEEGHYNESERPAVNYEHPESPDLELNAGELSLDDCVDRVIDMLKEKGVFA